MKRLCSFTLIVAIFFSLLNINVQKAFADTPTFSPIYWGDFRDFVEDTMDSSNLTTSQKNSIQTILDRCQSHLTNVRWNIVIAWDRTNGTFAFSPYSMDTSVGTGTQNWYVDSTFVNYQGNSVTRYNLNNIYETNYRDSIRVNGYVIYNGSTWEIVTVDRAYEELLIYKNWDYDSYCFYPSPYVWNAGFDCYCSTSLFVGRQYNNSSSYSFTANISSQPLIQDFNLAKFKLGDREYITITDQIWLSRMNPETMGYFWSFGGVNDGDSLVISYSDLTVIPNGQLFLNINFQNAPEYGIYAYDITDLNSNIYTQIVDSTIWELLENGYRIVAEAVNVPFDLQYTEPESTPYAETFQSL